MRYIFLISLMVLTQVLFGQEKKALIFPINDNGSHFFQVTFLNQTWLRYNQSNPGTLVQGMPQKETFDIGLRRTRIQMFGQINDRTFIYFQFGQNNFNAMYNSTGNRKLSAFMHDALCEYKISHGNELKMGGGLTITNGLSRFSQPSIGSIMTMDVPVFAQATVDQTDQFSRKLSVYARGQISKFDYRIVVSDPFPITSSGQTLPAISNVANFAQVGHHKQFQGYLMYQFFEHEGHTTPYMTGTYLGAKKVWNIAVGSIFQKNAMWIKGLQNDTVFQNMQLFAIESYLDMPVNKSKGTAISAHIGYYHMNYGTKYLRYNGAMNPANGTMLNSSNSIVGQGSTYGNAFPMFGTGQTIYSQVGYLFTLGKNTRTVKLLPYVSATLSQFKDLNGLYTNIYNAGINYLINNHQSKLTLDFQNRPTYQVVNGNIESGKRESAIVLQYQIFF